MMSPQPEQFPARRNKSTIHPIYSTVICWFHFDDVLLRSVYRCAVLTLKQLITLYLQ